MVTYPEKFLPALLLLPHGTKVCTKLLFWASTFFVIDSCRTTAATKQHNMDILFLCFIFIRTAPSVFRRIMFSRWWYRDSSIIVIRQCWVHLNTAWVVSFLRKLWMWPCQKNFLSRKNEYHCLAVRYSLISKLHSTIPSCFAFIKNSVPGAMSSVHIDFPRYQFINLIPLPKFLYQQKLLHASKLTRCISQQYL